MDVIGENRVINQKLNFGDTAREQWVAKILSKLPADSRLLDAGAGQLKNKKYCEHLDYVSQDFCQYTHGGNGLGIQKTAWDTSKIDIVSDITNIPENDASFDAVLCIAVIEHIPRPDLAMLEFYRLLKPNGQLILSAPFASTTHFAPYHFYSGFTRYFYENFLEEIGFKKYTIQPNGNFFDFIKTTLSQLPFFFDNFSKEKLSDNELDSLKTIMDVLECASEHSNGASELLNFGYNVHAIK